MQRAIQEGEKGFGKVAPNPLVGCVVLNSKHELISTGYHGKYGGPHAEIEAIKNISDEQLKGAHVVVTLEPCAHVGQTPSCAKTLSGLPIESVVYGTLDPNPLVAGQGLEILKKANKEVIQLNSFQDNCEDLSEIFLWNMRNKKAFVALKIASSLDGQIALQSGESQWITGEKSREYTHYLRGGYDAILVGRNTVVVDDPMLNIRHENFQGKENKVIILDPDAKLIKNFNQYKIYDHHKIENIIFVVKNNVGVSHSEFPVISVSQMGTGSLNLDELMQKLYQQKIYSVFVEGGAQTYSEFLSQKAFQRFYLFQAPVIIGTKYGRSWSESFSVSKLKDKLQLKNIKSAKYGNDLFLTARA